MQRFTFEQASPRDHEEILALFRIPMAGAISLALERDPDYFAGAHVQNLHPAVFVGRDNSNGRITGLFSVGHRPVFVNGEVQDIPYFCDLRIHPDYQNGTLLARGYRFVKQEVLNGRFAQTLIVSDNERAKASLTRGRAGLPDYFPAGEYVTYAISRAHIRSGRNVTRASESDIPEMEQFLSQEGRKKQFFPAGGLDLAGPYFRGMQLRDFFLLREGGSIAGLCGVWNQKAFKRTRVVSYSRPLRMVRPIYNAFVRVRGGIPLPPPGSVLDYSFLHCAVVQGNDPALLKSLLAAILTAPDLECGAFLLGLDASDPLASAVRGLPARAFHARHFLVGTEDPRPHLKPGTFYLEAARL